MGIERERVKRENYKEREGELKSEEELRERKEGIWIANKNLFQISQEYHINSPFIIDTNGLYLVLPKLRV